LRSVRSIVIAPARTGRDRRRRIAVMVTAHTNRGILSERYPAARMLMAVEIKLIAPRIEETLSFINTYSDSSVTQKYIFLSSLGLVQFHILSLINLKKKKGLVL